MSALEGLRVLDLTHEAFGYAGRLLAGFGAEVIKVEPPAGDPVRRQPPFAGDREDIERSVRHLHLNAGKRSVVLDLDTPEDQERLRELVRTADALVESLPPGYLAQRGLGYDELRALRPDLVMASVTWFGRDGPYAGYRGCEIVAAALGGYLALTGDRDREPVKCYDELVTQQAGLQAAVALMVGLTRRDLTGEGDYFDVSAQEAALFLLGGAAQACHFTGEVIRRNGTRLLFNFPEAFYPSTLRPCKDGWVHAHINLRHPDLMATLMEEPRLAEPEYRRMGEADAIDGMMDRWLARYDKFEVVRRAQEMRLPFTEVLTPEEVVRDEHLQARGFFVEVEHPGAGPVTQPGRPALMTATPWAALPAPSLGADAEAVLGERVVRASAREGRDA